jgi:hypothetical protein
MPSTVQSQTTASISPAANPDAKYMLTRTNSIAVSQALLEHPEANITHEQLLAP